MIKIVATKRIRETIEDHPKYRRIIEQSINKFEKDDWGDTPSDDVDRNITAMVRGSGLILGCYLTTKGYIHVYVDGKQDKIIVCFADEAS